MGTKDVSGFKLGLENADAAFQDAFRQAMRIDAVLAVYGDVLSGAIMPEAPRIRPELFLHHRRLENLFPEIEECLDKAENMLR